MQKSVERLKFDTYVVERILKTWAKFQNDRNTKQKFINISQEILSLETGSDAKNQKSHHVEHR